MRAKMPLVHIIYKSTVDVDTLRDITPVVNDTVAEQLCCEDKPEGFKVTPGMVKIRFTKAEELDSQMPDILIEVEGRAFKSRLGEQEMYASELGKAISPILPNGTSYGIWVKLCHAGWSAGTAE